MHRFLDNYLKHDTYLRMPANEPEIGKYHKETGTPFPFWVVLSRILSLESERQFFETARKLFGKPNYGNSNVNDGLAQYATKTYQGLPVIMFRTEEDRTIFEISLPANLMADTHRLDSINRYKQNV